MQSPMLDEIPNMIGHNKPPSEIEILNQRLADYNIEGALKRHEGRVLPVEIEDDETAGKISDYIAAVRATEDEVTKAHKKEKQPFWDAGKAADTWKNDLTAKLNTCVTKASPLLLRWNKKKEAEEAARQEAIAIKARIEADRLIEEAQAHEEAGITDTAQELLEAAAQADTKADLIQMGGYTAKVKSAGSFSSSGIKRPWVGKMESQAAIDLEVLRFYFKPEEIDAALGRAVRDGKREVRGAAIFQDEQLSTRRK